MSQGHFGRQKLLVATGMQWAAKYPVGSHSLRSGANAFAKEQGNPWAQETSPFDMTPICRRIFRFPVLRFVFPSSTSHLVIQVGWLTIPKNLLDEKGYYKKWHETCFTSSERITSISPKVLPFGRIAFSNTFQPFIHTKSWTITKKSTNVYQQVQEKCSEKYKSTNLLILLQPSHGFFCFPTSSLLFQTDPPSRPMFTSQNQSPRRSMRWPTQQRQALQIQRFSGHHTGTYDCSWGCAKRLFPWNGQILFV